MLTEEEAKTKWCPAYRFSAAIGPSGDRDGADNRPGAMQNSGLCLGSECMAWRPVVVNEMTEVVFAGTREGKPGTGFCGLAGQP